jgi:iron(III) transport system permease protein
LLPLTNGIDAARAASEIMRTFVNTLIYAGGAGLVAVSLGFLLAVSVGRDNQLRSVALAAALVIFTLPPSLGALGLIHAAANSPPWLDWLTRSRATVCIALGFRFLPVAVLVGLRSWGTVSQTWTHAAAVHGVPFTRFFSQVLLRHCAPAIGASVLLVGLLATAEVGTVLLIHPPGQSSLPLAIFTVMANAPESLVSSLCLGYLLLAFCILALLLICMGTARDDHARL